MPWLVLNWAGKPANHGQESSYFLADSSEFLSFLFGRGITQKDGRWRFLNKNLQWQMDLEMINKSPVNLIGRDGILFHSTYLDNIMKWVRESQQKCQPTVRLFMDIEEKLQAALRSLNLPTQTTQIIDEILSLTQNVLRSTWLDQWDISMIFVPNVESFLSLRSKLNDRERSALDLLLDLTQITFLFSVASILLREENAFIAAELSHVVNNLRNSLQLNNLSEPSMESEQVNLKTTSKHLFRRVNTDRMLQILDTLHKGVFGVNQHCCSSCDFFRSMFRRADNFIRPVISAVPLPGEANAGYENNSDSQRILEISRCLCLSPEHIEHVLRKMGADLVKFQGKQIEQGHSSTPGVTKLTHSEAQQAILKAIPMDSVALSGTLNPNAQAFVPKSDPVRALVPCSNFKEPEKLLEETAQVKPPRRRAKNTRL